MTRTQITIGQNAFDTINSYLESLDKSPELYVGACIPKSANINWLPMVPLKESYSTLVDHHCSKVRMIHLNIVSPFNYWPNIKLPTQSPVL